MKKKLVAVMLATVLTMCACASTSNNVAENTETSISTVEMVQVETEISTEKVAEPTEVATEIEVVIETEETTEIAADTETAEPEFAVVAMEATKYAKSSVNVRKGPSSDYEKIGSLSTNQKVNVIGQADTGWYQIELDGEIAYVSDNYLVDEKVAVNTTPDTNSGTNVGSENTADSSGTESDYVASTPDAPAPVEDDNASDDGNMSDWDDFTGGGAFDDCTDGYGPGVEIEITPTP